MAPYVICFFSHLKLCLYLPLTETFFSFFYPSPLIAWYSPEAKVVRPTQDTLRAARATGTSPGLWKQGTMMEPGLTRKLIFTHVDNHHGSLSQFK